MEKLKNKLELLTIEFYNCMIKDNQTRDFYRIDYYLYFLKKQNNKLFEENYIKTQTGIIWPDNEKLMFQLILLEKDGERNIIGKNIYSLFENEKDLINDIYNQYKGYSFTKLKELVNSDIENKHIFESLTIDEQLNILINNLYKKYSKNPEQIYIIINNMIKEIELKNQSTKIYKIS